VSAAPEVVELQDLVRLGLVDEMDPLLVNEGHPVLVHGPQGEVDVLDEEGLGDLEQLTGGSERPKSRVPRHTVQDRQSRVVEAQHAPAVDEGHDARVDLAAGAEGDGLADRAILGVEQDVPLVGNRRGLGWGAAPVGEQPAIAPPRNGSVVAAVAGLDSVACDQRDLHSGRASHTVLPIGK